ncbi:hypothetical protein Q7C36_016871 [Tachysurus vachellii]|uniref:Uncharacterized protein n=1 Tax=Tachysurus vachellii TaxID=175792 RepID=A0AA88M7H0_TACVA|nr:hypothetical protein Q7C36_016871 [Tachysurus vachellii]
MPVDKQEPPNVQQPRTRAQRATLLEEINKQGEPKSESKDLHEEWTSESEEEDGYPLMQFSFPQPQWLETSPKVDDFLTVLTDAGARDKTSVPKVAETENRDELVTDDEGMLETAHPLPPVQEPVVDTELEGGDVLSSSASDEEVLFPNFPFATEGKVLMRLFVDHKGYFRVT